MHSQNAREPLAFDDSVVEDLQNSMRWGSYSRIEELWPSGVAFEAWFPMVNVGCESEIRELKMVGKSEVWKEKRIFRGSFEGLDGWEKSDKGHCEEERGNLEMHCAC